MRVLRRSENAFVYRLLSKDGADLGQLVSAQREWHAGERFTLGQKGELEIVTIVPAEFDDAVRAYIVVRPLGVGRR